MKVLVLGGAGFVGLNVCATLLARGHRVIAADRAEIPPDALAELSASRGSLERVLVDIRDGAAVASLMACTNAEAVVHLAAITPDLTREMRSVSDVLSVNLGGLANCLDAITGNRAVRFVHVGSSAVFGRGPGPVWADDQPHAPTSLYGITKSAGEAIIRRWSQVHRRQATIARLGWVFGPFERDNGARNIMSLMLRLATVARDGGSAVLNRDACLDWLYAPDAGEAISRLVEAPHDDLRIYNIAPGASWPLSRWCARLSETFPGFRWSIGGAANVEANEAPDDPPLHSVAFQRDFPDFAFHGVEEALDDYLRRAQNAANFAS